MFHIRNQQKRNNLRKKDLQDMGNEESANGTTIRQVPAEMYLPIGGMRMSDEKGKAPSPQDSLTARTHQRTHIVRTAFSGIWSLEDSISLEIPSSRTGQFSCISNNENHAIIGFGVGMDGTYYNDIWILNAMTHEWSLLTTNGVEISPRSGSRATVIDNILYIFGGSREPMFYNDLYAVDLNTGNARSVQTSGSPPSPRTSPIFASYGKEIILWGGYDGSWPSELYVLNTENMEWKSYPQDIGGRTNVAYAVVENCIYAYGSSKTGGILKINMEDKSISLLPTTGPEPQASITDAGLVHFDRYLMFIGGKAASQSTLMYSLDIEKLRWFVFHILPDGATVSAVDGTISDLGLFMLPRTYSMGTIYIKGTREIVSFLGHPMKDPSPLFVLNIGEAIAALHLRSDMLATIQV
ncbi:Kelch motif family protein [Tritrichomonas foetus]|uniref:Kelch motif family protein n=1 Tax=Tritrichomonas foetus TaxID=1144522 RepID=A0A1J4L2E7_9EUKA|nr:Kelch motif family protein [Tritrichomonas foetus]|eukprot:OHT17681.1 Kelch motif family protein [Tritrichomonas foetus]